MSDGAGGTMGDPYQGMSIKKNVITIVFWGGARDKWGVTYKFRFQKGDFYLIGATNEGGDEIRDYKYDYNVNTGKLIIVEKDKEHPKNNKNETRNARVDT